MGSIKVVRTQLANAGMDVGFAQVLMEKLNLAFGLSWGNYHSEGLGIGSSLVLHQRDFRAFLGSGGVPATLVASPLAVIALPPPQTKIEIEQADYYETDARTFQCAHCSQKPYKRERDCIKHIEKKHAELLDDEE